MREVTTRDRTVRWGILSGGEMSGGNCPRGNLQVTLLPDSTDLSMYAWESTARPTSIEFSNYIFY